MNGSALKTFVWTLVGFLLVLPMAGAAYATDQSIHVVLVGDSTVAPNGGWGPFFIELAKAGVTCTNAARAGRSSKSFIDEGHWAKALALHGDYYLIQFGHNDQPGKGPDRETDPSTTYPANLSRFVDEARAQGGIPVLITSLARRDFSLTAPAHIESTLTPYAAAVTRVAKEKNVALIDLHRRSIDLCDQLGRVETAKFNRIKPGGNPDTTHISPAGGIVFAGVVVEELRRVVPELARFFRDQSTARAFTDRGDGGARDAAEPVPKSP